MPEIRAKFICISITQTLGNYFKADGKWEQGVVYSYKFQAVASGSEENRNFFAATPSGSIELSAVREGLFEIQQEYYLDFTPAAVRGIKTGREWGWFANDDAPPIDPPAEPPTVDGSVPSWWWDTLTWQPRSILSPRYRQHVTQAEVDAFFGHKLEAFRKQAEMDNRKDTYWKMNEKTGEAEAPDTLPRMKTHWPDGAMYPRQYVEDAEKTRHEHPILSLESQLLDADRDLGVVFHEFKSLLTLCHERREYKKAQNILYTLININSAMESLWEE